MPHFEATARFKLVISSGCAQKEKSRRTKDLVADVMLSNEVAEKLFVYTGFVDYLESISASRCHGATLSLVE
jgi:hypothetical protein